MSPPESYFSSKHQLYHNRFPVMGTRLDLIFLGMERSAAEYAFSGLKAEFRRLDKLLNRFDSYSRVSMVNKLAFKKTLTLDKELFGILLRCQGYYRDTGGLFDISLGKLADLVKSGRMENPRLEIGQLLENTGMDHIMLDQKDLSIRFLKPEISIDLGGLGKGYALDAAKTLLESAGISNTFISFGDSSVLAMGNHPHGSGWKAGIQHIFKPQDSVYAFHLHNESISTSGSTPGRKNATATGHVVHPVKGLLKEKPRQVSVKSASATDAEVLSTTLLLADDKEKTDILEAYPDCQAIQVDYDESGKSEVKYLTK